MKTVMRFVIGESGKRMGLDDEDDPCSLESLEDQEEDCPDCSNAFQCCLYRLGQCDGFPKNCPDFDC